MAFKGNNIPQAFTGKDVSEAFMWLQSQPEPIRKHIKSTDELMPLYFRYKRTGTLALFESSAPASQLSFQESNQTVTQPESKFSDTLKNLRKEIDSFGPTEPPQAATIQPSSAVKPQQPADVPFQASNSETYSGSETQSQPMNLDIKSLEIVETIRRGLNLSSQEEVIRMCLVLGFEKLKSILP